MMSPSTGKTERLKVGGPQRVLLVVDPAPLLMRMSEMVRAFPGLQLAGAFTNAGDAVEWTVWEGGDWHYAFVDLNLPGGGSEDLIRRLLSQQRPGSIVALGAHLWKEIREDCARMGVYHLLEKGDPIAFNGFLEDLVR